jgi:hypothetical protein
MSVLLQPFAILPEVVYRLWDVGKASKINDTPRIDTKSDVTWAVVYSFRWLRALVYNKTIVITRRTK